MDDSLDGVEFPMFPLGTVLFPHGVLPLRVFEPRYRAMVTHCLERDARFGVVLIERGSEVGGGDTRFHVGTVAQIVQAAFTPDLPCALILGWDDCPNSSGVIERDILPVLQRGPSEAVMVALARDTIAAAARQSRKCGGPIHTASVDAKGSRWIQQ